MAYCLGSCQGIAIRKSRRNTPFKPCRGASLQAKSPLVGDVRNIRKAKAPKRAAAWMRQRRLLAGLRPRLTRLSGWPQRLEKLAREEFQKEVSKLALSPACFDCSSNQ